MTTALTCAAEFIASYAALELAYRLASLAFRHRTKNRQHHHSKAVLVK